MRILAFLPTYNERENIEQLLRQLFSLPCDLHAVVVDDLSPDGTGQLVENLKQEYPDRLEIIHRRGARGRGFAGVCGFEYAAGREDVDWVLEMDADGSHRPEDIPRLLEASCRADVVLGSRYVPGGKVIGWSPFRYLNSFVAGLLSRIILGLKYKDPTSGFRLFRREVVNCLPWKSMVSNNPSIVEEILYHCRVRGYRIVEAPITFVDRRRGSSKFSVKMISRWILNLWQVRKKVGKNV